MDAVQPPGFHAAMNAAAIDSQLDQLATLDQPVLTCGQGSDHHVRWDRLNTDSVIKRSHVRHGANGGRQMRTVHARPRAAF